MAQITDENVNHLLVNMLDDEEFMLWWDRQPERVRSNIRELIQSGLETIVQGHVRGAVKSRLGYD